VLPSDVEQVSNVVKLAKQADVPIVPRGSARASPAAPCPPKAASSFTGATQSDSKIDLENRIAIVEPA